MTGEKRRCEYITRKDNYKGESHNCPQISVISYLNSKPQEDRQESHLEDSIIELIGKESLDVQFPLKHPFIHVIEEAIRLGQQNPLVPIRELLPNFSASNIRNRFITRAEIIRDDILEDLKTLGYCSLAIDAGTVNNLKLLLFVVTNPYSTRKPLMINANYNFSGDRKGYIESIRNTLLKTSSMGLNVISIVSDNHPVQISSLSDPEFKCIPRFSCMCHTLELAIKDIFNNQKYQGAIDIIKRAAEILKEPKISNAIGHKCPNFCRTRWNYAYNILSFATINTDLILSLVNDEQANIRFEMDEDKDIIKKLYSIIIPMMTVPLLYVSKLIKIFESDKTPMSFVIPLIEKAKHKMLSASSTICSGALDFANDIIACIEHRLLINGKKDRLLLLHYLTPLGRLHFREHTLEEPKRLDPSNIKAFKISFGKLTKIEEKVIETIQNSLLPLLKKKRRILPYRQVQTEPAENMNLEHFLETYDSDNDSDFEPYSESCEYNTDEDYLLHEDDEIMEVEECLEIEQAMMELEIPGNLSEEEGEMGDEIITDESVIETVGALNATIDELRKLIRAYEDEANEDIIVDCYIKWLMSLHTSSNAKKYTIKIHFIFWEFWESILVSRISLREQRN